MPPIPAEQVSPYGLSGQGQNNRGSARETTNPHQRQGDRGSGDDAAARRLPTYVRFRDIQAANIARNWQTLNRLIDEEGFPVGSMLSPNMRAWKIDDVEVWLASRPTERKGVPDRWEQRAP